MKPYLEEIGAVLKELGTSLEGLSPEEANRRLVKHGANKLEEKTKKPIWLKLLHHTADPMVLVLAAAALISGLFGEHVDAVVIGVVVILNAALGVYQEGKAEKAIQALQQMAAPCSRVKRNGKVMEIKSEEIVPGDIVLIQAGDAVPADLRIIESASLRIEESALTGESVPVEKTSRTIPGGGTDIPLADRANMAYMGTSVVYGRGTGVVVATGMKTEMGKIASMISLAADEKTPLQIRLAELSKMLSLLVLAVCALIFVLGVLKNGGFFGGQVFEMFMIAVSLAVAAIPEGLVAVVTVVLSIGVTQMSKRNAIIRRLTAVETLGCTEIICSDKTGTLTQNKMTVVETYGDSELLLQAMVLCNDVQIAPDGTLFGDPTETALVRYGLENGLDKESLEEIWVRRAEIPFDSERKMMTTLHEKPRGGYIQFTKGAPDAILQACAYVTLGERAEALTEDRAREVAQENHKMANQSLRVLGFAFREHETFPSEVAPELLEKDLVFVGLVGMIDPIRPEVLAAVHKCRTAGIRPIMITGDHKDTAVAIARELGILTDQSKAITGAELSAIPQSEFEKAVERYSVYARVQPEHKVRIVDAWQKRGKITAMTGDGVNDAPALKAADIGVGMGITGTDVTKSVADMVLADDNFATIVDAVEEGRRIYDNIRKVVQFLLASNLSEVVAIFTAMLFNYRLFAPIHILWINLITDSFPAIALGTEAPEEDVMKRPPRSPKESIFAGGVGFNILYQGLTIAALTLASFFVGYQHSQATAMSMAFVTLSMCEIFHSLNMRFLKRSIFGIRKQNRYLLAAMVVSFFLTLAVVYLPGLNKIFRLVPLSPSDFTAASLLAFAIIPVVEVVKAVQRMKAKTL